jgi:quercetin dioxygenase-like cupin family protein
MAASAAAAVAAPIGVTSLASAATAEASPGPPARRCSQGSVQRYVIGTGADGQSYTQFSECSATSGQVPGGVLTGKLWTTQQMPVNNSGAADEALSGQGTPGSLVGPDGTSFGWVYYPAGQPGTQPVIHRTATTDYWVILEGEATLATDQDRIHLRAGDTVVIRGANHGWAYPPGRPFLAVSVSLDATPTAS